MNKFRKRWFGGLVLVLMGLWLGSVMAAEENTPPEGDAVAAQAEPQVGGKEEVILYQGSVAESEYGLKLGGWGSGKAEEDNSCGINNKAALWIKTFDYYRGGRLDFANGPTISNFFGENASDSFLEIDAYFFKPQAGGAVAPGAGIGAAGAGEGGPAAGEAAGQPAQGTMRGAGGMMGMGMMGGGQPGAGGMMGGGMPGAGGMMGMGMMGGRAGGGGMLGAGAGGEGAGAGAGMAAREEKPPISKLRIVLDTTEGPLVLEDYAFNPDFEVVPGWTRLLIPLSAFKNPGNVTPSKLKRILLFGNEEDEFYIARAKLVRDTGPLLAKIQTTKKEFPWYMGYPLTLPGYVLYGTVYSSDLEYIWDFGDGKDQIKGPPEGQKFTGGAVQGSHTYEITNQERDVTITLTAIDPSGHKPPASDSVTVQLLKPPGYQPQAGAQATGGQSRRAVE